MDVKSKLNEVQCKIIFSTIVLMKLSNALIKEADMYFKMDVMFDLKDIKWNIIEVNANIEKNLAKIMDVVLK